MTTALEKLLRPRSIAILGASADFNKIGGRPLKFLIEKGFPGRILPVNPRYETIGDLPCYPDIGAVPGPVDLAVVALAADLVIETVEALGAAGVPAAVVFSSGFGEMGPEGRVREATLLDTARKAGVRILGPNGLGHINAFDRVYGTFTQYAYGETPAGPAAFVTQSGAFGTAISALARSRGVGFGYFVNTGNECDLGFSEIMEAVLADDRVRVGAGYIEGLAEGTGLIQAAERARSLGKPIVLTKVGRTASGARAAASHTGSLAGEDAVFDGVVRQYGLLRARNEEHMLDLVEVLALTEPPAGRRVGIVTQSGGAGVLMADRAEELGLEVPQLGPETVSRLRDILPAFGAANNPVDVTAQFITEPEILRESVKALLDDPEIDIAVIWFQLMDQFVDELMEIFKDLKASTTKPIVACWVAGPADGIRRLRTLGYAVLRGAEPAIDAVEGLVRHAEAGRKITPPPPSSVELPPLPEEGGIVSGAIAARLLRHCDVPLVETSFASDRAEAEAAAATLGYPVVMKIDSPDLPHKTEIDGVALGLGDATEVGAAYGDIMAAVGRHAPEARIDGVVIQEMLAGPVELVLGLKRDPIFGPVVMAGLGGIHVEILKDVVFRHAPIDEAGALEMLADLKVAAILDGVRGRPAVDKAALARLIAAVSRLGAALGNRLREFDLNPVFAGPEGAVAVDWLLVLDPADENALPP